MIFCHRCKKEIDENELLINNNHKTLCQYCNNIIENEYIDKLLKGIKGEFICD